MLIVTILEIGAPSKFHRLLRMYGNVVDDYIYVTYNHILKKITFFQNLLLVINLSFLTNGFKHGTGFQEKRACDLLLFIYLPTRYIPLFLVDPGNYPHSDM